MAIGVTNTVNRTHGAWSVAKSSDPPSGTVVEPGSTITYTVTVNSTGAVPVHDVVVTDDLAGVLPYGSVVEGSIVAPDGTTAAVDAAGQRLVWTVGAVPAGTSLTLSYQVQVRPDAVGVTIGNQITATADVPPTDCAAPVAVTAAPAAVTIAQTAPCGTHHQTPCGPTLAKELTADPVLDPNTGAWTVRYRISGDQR